MDILNTSKELVKIATKIANPELLQAAYEAQEKAFDLSTKNLEMQQTIDRLEKQIQELEGKLKLTGEVFREGDFVFREGEERGYCSRCWDVDHNLVHIILIDLGKGGGLANGCPQCKIGTRGRGQNPKLKQPEV